MQEPFTLETALSHHPFSVAARKVAASSVNTRVTCISIHVYTEDIPSLRHPFHAHLSQFKLDALCRLPICKRHVVEHRWVSDNG